jgi:hypothetical protein
VINIARRLNRRDHVTQGKAASMPATSTTARYGMPST